MSQKNATKGQKGLRHPGEIIQEEILDRHNLTVYKVARIVKFTDAAISNLLKGQAGLTSKMALAIEERLKDYHAYTAEDLMRFQTDYELGVERGQIRKKPTQHSLKRKEPDAPSPT